MLKRRLVMLVVLGVVSVMLPTWGFSGFDLPVSTSPTYVKIYQDSDWLWGKGDSWTYTGTFHGGTRYKFTLSVPWDADFDIKIFDENGNLVAAGTRDRGSDETVYITPAWTGTFRIKVYSYDGSGYYTLKVCKKVYYGRLPFSPSPLSSLY